MSPAAANAPPATTARVRASTSEVKPRENHQEAFNTELVGRAVDELRLAGFEVSDDDVAHLGPTMTEHLNVHGRYHFDLSATEGSPAAVCPLSVDGPMNECCSLEELQVIGVNACPSAVRLSRWFRSR